jgi:hypothetical protein
MSELSTAAAPELTRKSELVDENDENGAVGNQAKKLKLADENGENDNNADEKLTKKKKYALLVGYSGEGYFGLQRFINLKII